MKNDYPALSNVASKKMTKKRTARGLLGTARKGWIDDSLKIKGEKYNLGNTASLEKLPKGGCWSTITKGSKS